MRRIPRERQAQGEKDGNFPSFFLFLIIFLLFLIYSFKSASPILLQSISGSSFAAAKRIHELAADRSGQ